MNTDNGIENVLAGMDPELAKLIGPPPAAPIPVGHTEVHFSPKEAKAAERALDKGADAFTRARVGGTYLRKFGAIAQAIPGAERIRIRKRREGGNLGYIGEYNFRDLAGVGDLESFIARFAKPKHGPGEYDVTIIDNMNKEYPGGSVFMEGEPIDGGTGGGNMVDLVREMMLQNNRKPTEDPMDSLRRATAFAAELKGSGNDPMVMMAMMNAMAPKPSGPDPMLLATLERLAGKIEKMESAASMAPPMMSALPPMPPAAPPVDWLALGSTLVLPLLQMMQQNSQNNTQMLMAAMQSKDTMSTKDMLMLMEQSRSAATSAASTDKLSMRDVIELLQKKNDEGRPQNTIEDQMEAMVKMKEFATAFAPQQQSGPQGASFWDALVALASSQDISGAMAERIRTRQTTATVESRPALPSRSSVEVVGEQRQAPQQEAPAQKPAQIPLPAFLKDECAKITMAGDSPTRIQAVVETLFALQKTSDFRPFVMALLEATAKNDMEKTLHGLGRWLNLLGENGLVTRETALQVIGDFKTNWEDIRGLLLERIPGLKNLSAPVASTAPAAPAAPAVPTVSAVADHGMNHDVPDDVDLPDDYAVPVM